LNVAAFVCWNDFELFISVSLPTPVTFAVYQKCVGLVGNCIRLLRYIQGLDLFFRIWLVKVLWGVVSRPIDFIISWFLHPFFFSGFRQFTDLTLLQKNMELSQQVSSSSVPAEKVQESTSWRNFETKPINTTNSKCPLYCPKPRRVTPFHNLSLIRYDGDSPGLVRENGYISRENSEKMSVATGSSFSGGSWLTFEDGGSVGDISDVSRRFECNSAFGTGDKQEAESIDWSSSPSPCNNPKTCENPGTCVFDTGSQSCFSAKSLAPEKSKTSLVSECTSYSTNLEDFDYPIDEKTYDGIITNSPPERSENPMVRDAWFRLSLKGLVADSELKSEAICRAHGEGDVKRRRNPIRTNSFLSAVDKSYAHLRFSPALSV